MPAFSAKSRAALATCHPELRRLLNRVIEAWDCTILEGKRTEDRQRLNVEIGVSKTLDSKHVYPLESPSLAVDVAPYPLRWPKPPKDSSPAEFTRAQKDVSRYYFFAGFVLATARELGIDIRYGGDWDSDRDIHEERFDDLVHFELRPA